MEKNNSSSPNLSAAYDAYGDFSRNAYFTLCYNALPSNLRLATPLKEGRENMDAVISMIDFETYSLKYVRRKWDTKDASNADLANDYVYEHLLKSESRPLLVYVSLAGDEIFIEFIYDVEDLEVEEWVIATNHTIRSRFGEELAPAFKILSRNSREFYTEEVNTGNFLELEVESLYNDDFMEMNEIINHSIENKKTGLILLHGKPGTGKTSYIKHLISKFEDESFIFVQNEFVKELLKPEFISFMVKHRSSILIIEDAEKIIVSRESSEDSVVSTILQLTDGLFSDYLNIKVICSFNSKMDKIDTALLRKGRMIANYEFKPLNKEKANRLTQSLGYKGTDRDMTLAEIFNLKEKDFGQLKQKKIGFR